MADPTPPASPADVPDRLVACLAAALGFEFALVGVVDERSGRVRSLAASANGRPTRFEYELAGSPCALTVERGAFVVPRDASGRFPGDPDLVAIGAEGYAGASFVDAVTGGVALVAAMSRAPIEDEARALEVVRTFAACAAAARRARADAIENALVREALSAAGQGFLVVDARGAVLRENVEARLLAPSDDPTRNDLAERLGEGAAPALAALAERRVWRGRVVVRVDRAPRTLHVEVVPRPAAAGDAFVLLRDVTEVALQTEQLALALDAAGAGLWDWDVSTGRVETRGHYFAMLGFGEPPRDFTVDGFAELLHPDDRERTFEAVRRAHAPDGSTYDLNFRLRCADGRHRWVRSFGRVVERAPDGTALRMIGHHVDVEQQMRRAERLERLEQRLRLFVENTTAPVAMLDRELRFMTASRGYLDRYRCGEVEGRSFEEVFGPLRPSWTELMRRCLAGESLTKSRARLRGPGGTVTHARWSMKPWRDARGDVGGLVLQIETIDDQLEHEARLAEARDQALAASRARGEFLANVSHEIRTPMTAILGFADALSDPRTGEAERQEYLETIRRNGRHLLDVINAVLDLSKIDAGRLSVEREPVDAAHVAREVVRTFEAHAREKDVALSSHVPDGGAWLLADALRLRQVLTNLVGNAVKFTERGGVVVSVGACGAGDERRLLVEVADTGIGMSAEQVASVFEPFVQADGSTTRRFGGTGLGLSVSRRLAELMGGSLVAESELGVGTRFRLTLPAPPVPAAERGAPRPPEPLDLELPAAPVPARPLLGLRVLLAEDGADNRRLVGLVLARAGAEVTAVESGDAVEPALRAAREEGRPYAAVLMDMQMPVLDGYEATRCLRAAGWSVPVVALTAHAMAGDREQCLAAGCDDYLSKPIDRVRLVATLQRLAGPSDALRAPRA